jgi:hypothetical protein
MGNLSKNSIEDWPSPKPAKPDKRWTLLFIGNHGRTITLKRFKGMVLLTCLVLCLCLAITAGLLYVSLNIRQEKNRLASDLQDFKAQIKALRYEKDVLMTKLVLAESRSPAGPAEAAAPESQPQPRQSTTNDQPDADPSAQPAKVPAESPAEAAAAAPPADTPPDAKLSVALEDFNLSADAEENLLRVQFKIKNTSANSQRVAGYAIVVLKGEQLRTDKWLAIPRIALSDGRPTGRQRGYAFGINHFKTMRFKTNLPRAPEMYQQATAFIFSEKGDLLLEQDFPVNLPPVAPAAASKPAAGSTATEAPSTAAAAQPASSDAPAPSTDELIDSLKDPTAE